MKHIFIINPTAGKSDSRQRIYDMADSLRTRHDLDVQCILTKRQGHATELAKKLCQTGEELRFYACGGDGTVNEVANGIIGYDNAAMSVIPIGTGNDFLKNFGSDISKFRDAENLWNGPQFPIDAIQVNDRIALTIACSGIDARVANDVHKFSESPILDGKSSYIVALAANFLFKGIGSHWTVSLDGVAEEKDYSLQRALLRRRLHARGRGADGRRRAEHADGGQGFPHDVFEICGAVFQGRLRPVPPSGALLHCQGHHHLLQEKGHHHLSGRRVHHYRLCAHPSGGQKAEFLRPRGLRLQRHRPQRHPRRGGNVNFLLFSKLPLEKNHRCGIIISVSTPVF